MSAHCDRDLAVELLYLFAERAQRRDERERDLTASVHLGLTGAADGRGPELLQQHGDRHRSVDTF